MGKPNGYQSFLHHAAVSYGSDPGILDTMARLESSYDVGSVNTWDSNAAAGHPSKGIMQFIKPTFEGMSRRAYEANPTAWTGIPRKWGDWRAQILTASWAIKHGQGSAWATYGRAQAHATGPEKRVIEAWSAIQPSTGATHATGGKTSGNALTARGLTPAKRAALAMVFDDNAFMTSLIGQIPDAAPATKIDVVRPTHGIAGALPTNPTTPSSNNPSGGIGDQLVQTALSQVGKTANDAMRYIKAAGGSGYEPWCGDFVQWVFKQRGLHPPPARSVPALLAWAKQNHKRTQHPKPGDLVIFDWNGDGTPDHVEIVQRRIKGGVHSVGGNTSGPKPGMQVADKDRIGGNQQYISAA